MGDPVVLQIDRRLVPLPLLEQGHPEQQLGIQDPLGKGIAQIEDGTRILCRGQQETPVVIVGLPLVRSQQQPAVERQIGSNSGVRQAKSIGDIRQQGAAADQRNTPLFENGQPHHTLQRPQIG